MPAGPGRPKGNFVDLIKAKRLRKEALAAEIRKQNRLNYRKWLRYRARQLKLRMDYLSYERPMFMPHEIEEMDDMRLHVMLALQPFDSFFFRTYSRRSIVEQAINHVLTGAAPPPRWMQQVATVEARKQRGETDPTMMPPKEFVAALCPVAVEAAKARHAELVRRLNREQ
jgi:hypothetical protein